ncbi:HAMP domain-containing histidine kinase [Planomonospora sp. ID67723]|uniref:sensor histidine kinase n=1 Tax=Planomonospora sp. ID67723 TaxID=2738134 RepID=UPI0018C40E48|nr:HAMP domain-containing sensor histidine kinase [Planomonospora sp. ID67723]MBG0827696.1 HAMP domain-containing histidine kinase [Planomonospora sp. ID67723]
MSLRARLLTGLLAVSTTLLLTFSGVSVFVLHEHLLQRVDGQLRAATATAVRKLAAAPGGALSQTLTGSTYAVAVFPLSGRARLVNGDAPEAAVVPHLLERLGTDRLRGYAATQERFDLDPTGEYRLMARVAEGRQHKRLVIVAVSMESVDAPIRRLVAAELLTGGLLILLLALIGRTLINRGLAPLAQIAGTAYAMASDGDLSVRMPEGPSEVGRLGAAVNLLLERIAGAFRDRRASEERVRRFAADASHELRTPLSTIRGYAELYRTGALGAGDLPRVMGRIEDEATRMGELVGQMLELARLDRSAGLQPAETDLAAVARDVSADHAAIEPDMPVVVDVPDTLTAVVDEARIRQVLVNLLANVRAHTPKGTVAALRLARSPDGGVLIEVRDDGPGMSREQVVRAFDRFHRGGERVADGAGLGLSIVKAITDAHGGRCWITSAPGAGTGVHVALPAVPRLLGSFPQA